MQINRAVYAKRFEKEKPNYNNDPFYEPHQVGHVFASIQHIQACLSYLICCVQILIVLQHKFHVPSAQQGVHAFFHRVQVYQGEPMCMQVSVLL